MSARALPEHPDLGQLRRQAKELRDAARAGDETALERIRAHLPTTGPASLATAQLVIAREHGFASWPRLKAEVETRGMDLAARARAFLDDSLRGPMQPEVHGRDVHAARLLAADPRIATYDIRTATVLGEADHLRRLLDRDRALAVRPDPESGLPPLLFVCLSRWHRIDSDRAPGMLEAARMLLDAGASPDTAVGTPTRPGYCAALYAAAGLARSPAIADLLLDRGADPDTPAALYHTALHDDPTCLRLLLDRGARAESADALAAAISIDNVEAVRLLLDAVIDPRNPLPAEALGERYDPDPPIDPVYAAIEHHCSTELITLLLDRGADPDARGQSPWSALQLARRRGRTEVAALLRRYGARDDATVLDRFLEACARGDRASAERLAGDHPDMLDLATEEDRVRTIAQAADHGNAAAVDLMLDLGFPLDAHEPDHGATPLHAAAAGGSADLVRLLLDRGADIDARDATFGATPLAWATVGSRLNLGHNPNADRVATVRVLLDAGASAEGAWVGGKPPSPAVADLLHAYGIVADEPIGGSLSP